MGAAKNRQPPVTVPESVQGILGVAETFPKNESGTFWSFDGQKLHY
jgi:hypothetical protein